jgi:hypothetical protein
MRTPIAVAFCSPLPLFYTQNVPKIALETIVCSVKLPKKQQQAKRTLVLPPKVRADTFDATEQSVPQTRADVVTVLGKKNEECIILGYSKQDIEQGIWSIRFENFSTRLPWQQSFSFPSRSHQKDTENTGFHLYMYR